MSIEDVADRADVWSDAIKKIIKEVTAADVACVAAVSAVLMMWPSDGKVEPSVRTDLVPGYGPQCSQLYNTIEHTWTEEQWTLWERLRKDLGC